MIDESKRSAGLELSAVVQVERVAADVLVIRDNQSFDLTDAATVDDAFGSEQTFSHGGASDA